MKLKQFLLLSSVVCLTILSACKEQKPYKINGTIDLPEQMQYADTIIDVPSFEGTWVYMLDLENQLLDSAQITSNSFHFIGEVDPQDTYYVQLLSQIGSALVVVEPGNIEVYFSLDISVSGTPSNEAMSDMDAALENLNLDTYNYMAQLRDSLHAKGEELSEEQEKLIFDEFQEQMYQIIDSIYNNNKDNQAAAYAVLMRNMHIPDVDGFEKELAQYPKSIQDNELIKVYLRAMRQYQEGESGENQTFDPSVLGIEEVEAVPEN